MVYSTCTFSPLENEAIVSWALNTYPALQLERLPGDLWKLGSDGLDGFGLNMLQREMVRRFDPDHADDSIGFFLSALQKNA